LQLLLEEFGKWLNATVKADMPERNKYFSIVFDEVNKQINAGTYMKVSVRRPHACSVPSSY
jgi:hypothetical protein